LAIAAIAVFNAPTRRRAAARYHTCRGADRGLLAEYSKGVKGSFTRGSRCKSLHDDQRRGWCLVSVPRDLSSVLAEESSWRRLLRQN
jgi:hypothetical protein